MTDAAKFNIASQRNEDFGPFEGRFKDAGGAATDMTGWQFELHISQNLEGLPPTLTVTGTPSGAGSYVRVIEPAFGAIELFLARDDIAALPGDPEQDGLFFFNLMTLEPDGTSRAFARGRFIAEPGIGMYDSGGGILIVTIDEILVTETGAILRF